MSQQPSPAVVTTVVSLLQQIGGRRYDAVHVAAALKRYETSVRANAQSVPPSLRELRAAFAEVGSPRVTEAHHGAEVEEPLHSTDDGLVPDLLTREQTAKRLCCSVATVKRREADGLLHPVRHGRIVRYHRAEIEALIAVRETG